MVRRSSSPELRFSTWFDLKVDIRRRALDMAGGGPVLDAFAGQGVIWRAVLEDRDDVDVVAIEYEPDNAQAGAIVGDNVAVLADPEFDVSRFALIDLDAYGWPDDQMAILRDRFAGRPRPVVVTTVSGGKYATTPRRVTDLSGYPPTFRQGPPSQIYDLLWTRFVNWCGWDVVERHRSRSPLSGGQFIMYEILKDSSLVR